MSSDDISPSYYIEWSFWFFIWTLLHIFAIAIYILERKEYSHSSQLRAKTYRLNALKTNILGEMLKLISIILRFPDLFLEGSNTRQDILAGAGLWFNTLGGAAFVVCIYQFCASMILQEIHFALTEASMTEVHKMAPNCFS